MKKPLLLTFALTITTLFSAASMAHHSFAMFDQTIKVEFTGIVSDVQWTNPHVWIEVDVPQDDGSSIGWAVEFTSRVHLTRRGFTKAMVNEGDEVTFVVSPYADGRPGGRFYTIQLANGEFYRDPGARAAYQRSLQAADQ